ncbi:sugar phosphate isomerase/epimerase [Gammaproteobacteria bacterium]|nr:sugar phosphate isomerase/epimerase [Gammaproteobacteria bacterium]MDB2602065.1 sugar phosphate isomerase/epimerase [Gammaproteobacteria bacterium]
MAKTKSMGRLGSTGLSRRTFLTRSALVAGGIAGSSLFPFAASAQSRRVDNIGLQLYTLRKELAEDFDGTLARVAELGFKEMEFAGYYGRSAAQIKTALETNGLVSPAAHIQWAAIRDNLQAEIDRAVGIGQRYIVIPYLQENERTLDHYKRLIDTLNSAGEACRDAGLKIAYHNHDFEFDTVDGVVPYDLLLKETDPDLVDMELDLFWIAYAGADPLAYIKDHSGRFSMLHVKDLSADRKMTAVGEGAIDFEAIFAHADTGGFKHYFVEHDNPIDAFDSVTTSIASVRGMRF